jgi:hypothetical protein
MYSRRAWLVAATTAALALTLATPVAPAFAHAGAVAAGAAAADPVAADPVAEYKRTHDAAPKSALSPADVALLAAKQGAATARGLRSASALTSSRTLRVSRQLQQTGYWCGPAATSMALYSLGIGLSQSAAANLLKTNTDGTAWYGVNARLPAPWPTGYPIRDVLNYKLGRNFYVPVALAYNPTADDKHLYQIMLQSDINAGYPLVGNAWEVPGGPHLSGHPNIEIMHWYTMYGFYSSGAGTYYVDSASYAANGGYGAMSSDTITVINGGRGYIW